MSLLLRPQIQNLDKQRQHKVGQLNLLHSTNFRQNPTVAAVHKFNGVILNLDDHCSLKLSINFN